MVTTETSYLSKECHSWVDILRSQREEMNRMRTELQNISANITDKEMLERVEHYENQFEIQLNNIHDLKKNIKLHNQMGIQQYPALQGMPPELAEDHEKLSFDYAGLRKILHELKIDFRQFVASHS